MKKSELDNAITRICETGALEPAFLRLVPLDSPCNTGSFNGSELDEKIASLTIPYVASRRRGRQASILQAKIENQLNCTVDNMTELLSSDLTLLSSDFTQPEFYEKLLRFLWRSKTSRKFVILPLKDVEYWLSLAGRRQPHLCVTAQTLPNGGAIMLNLLRTGPKRTKKRSSTRGKRSGRGK